jgi:hypothetical protein
VSKHPYPVRVSADGEVAVRQETDPQYPHFGPWHSTSGASLSDRQVADWTPYAPAPETAAAVLTAALDEWSAHWPPRNGDDIDPAVYDRLAELDADALEKLAHAAGQLSRQAWDVRHEKLVDIERARLGIAWARVNVDVAGQLLPESVVTVGEVTAAVPLKTDTGGIIAPHRLTAALRPLGYLPIDFSDAELGDGVLKFLVRKVPADD